MANRNMALFNALRNYYKMEQAHEEKVKKEHVVMDKKEKKKKK